MADTAASLRQVSSSLAALASAFDAQAGTVSGMLSSARGSVVASVAEWGGPSSDAILGAGEDYVDLVEPVVRALESAHGTVSRWATSAEGFADRLAVQASRLWSLNHAAVMGHDSDTAVYDRRRANALAGEIRAEWQLACGAFATELEGSITPMFNATMAVASLVDPAAFSDGSYYATMAELAVTANVDISVIDANGDLAAAIAAQTALVGSDDGALIFAVLETANQGDFSKSDGNLSEEDIIASCDAATVRALLEQAAAEQGIELDPAQLDGLVADVVGTAWMMRSSGDDVWEDIDDDIGWYETGVASFVREELFAPVAALAVGGLCVGAAGVGTVVTGGAAAAAVGYCGGLAAGTYNAADTWANGGNGGDVLNAFTDPETWAWGATSSLAIYGATSYLLRTPSVGPLGAADDLVDDTYHYTFQQYTESIAEDGLRIRSSGARIFTTPNGELSPLQAQIELALPPNQPLRNAVIQIDLAGMRAAGYEIPTASRITNTVTAVDGRVYSMPGGGTEIVFDYAIPPEFIKVVVG